MTLKDSLSRNLLILSAVPFLNDASSELMAALLPLFVTQLGGGALSVGLLGGLREAASNFLKIASGYTSDKIKERKPFAIAGYGLSALFKLLILLSQRPTQVVVFSSLERLGKGIRSAPREAILSLSGSLERSFAVHRAFNTLGALTGVALALMLTSKLPVRGALFVGAFLSLLSIPLLLFLKEPEFEVRKKSKGERRGSSRLKKFLFLLASTLFSLSWVSFMFFILKGEEVTSSQRGAILP